MTLLGSAAIVLAAACGGGVASAAPEQELKITLSDFKYDPPSWQVKPGLAIHVTLTNKGSVEHDFRVDATGFKLLVPAARTISKTLPPLQAGAYEVTCTIVGHKEAGMSGTLTVK